jgi:2-polyprenyl-3-methyl-5-hydroxy-6-metoxy-1,4-benzoquinol methylase
LPLLHSALKKLHIKRYIIPFVDVLIHVDADSVTQHAYANRYLKYLQANAYYFTRIYADLLQILLIETDRTPSQISLLDYGAGNGLLGLFAKYCGFKKVYINDLDPDFLEASKRLSEFMKIEIDGFLSGDIGLISKDSAMHSLDAVVGTDVIEHIYDLDLFFQKIREMNPNMLTCFTTASNPENTFKCKKIRKLQWKDEWEGSATEYVMDNGSEEHPPYRELRKNILSENFSGKELEDWIRVTRGKNRSDILQAIESHRSGAPMPEELNDPYNTCHPETGSWTERILSLETYRSLYASNGFSLTIQNGYFNQYGRSNKKIVLYLLNRLIIIFGTKIAPFIFLKGIPVKKQPSDKS